MGSEKEPDSFDQIICKKTWLKGFKEIIASYVATFGLTISLCLCCNL